MKFILIYVIPIFFILTWWYFAFFDTLFPEKSRELVRSVPPKTIVSNSPLVVDRGELHQALNGDIHLMCSLIAEWDLEAEALISENIPSIQRLPRSSLKEVLTLWRKDEISTNEFYYPQTYLASGILMALVPEKNILALPKGFRTQESLFPKEKTDLIPLDADPYHLEAIGNAENIVAFISPYSHPNTILALRQRSIPTVNLGAVQTQNDLKEAIRKVGDRIGANRKSKILCHFVDAAVMAMNNHLTKLSRKSHPEVLYLNYRTFFSAPNQKTLAGHMLNTLKINQNLPGSSEEDWEIPLEIEDILMLDPDCLILSTSHKKQTLSAPLSGLKAFKNDRVYFVDKNIQETPSQHFLLGYFDLYQILAEVYDD